MPSIIISGKTYSYSVIRKSVGSLSLRIKSRHSFIITSPTLFPEFMIGRFIKEHQSWILKNSLKFKKTKLLKTLTSLQIVGKDYELIIKKSTRDSVVIFKDEYKIYANTSHLLNSHLKKLLDSKLRPFALSIITSELRELSTLYPFKYSHVSVKNTTSRFGSCSSTNNLNFNWQIIFFPKDIFRHILLHELTHTIHHNHSPLFWQQFAKFDPSWRLNRHYLKTKGQKHFIV